MWLVKAHTSQESCDARKWEVQYTVDVMDIMTKLRKDWGMTYPEEEM